MKFKRAFLAATVFSAALYGCGKESKSDKDNKGKDKPNEEKVNDPDSDDAVLKDEYQGVYRLTSQVETPYGSCDDAEATPVEDFGVLPDFFKLDTVYEFTMDPTDEPKVDLWLHECTDEKTCGGQVINFLFPEKTDGVWGGQTSLGISNSFEGDTCMFSYTERMAVLTGKDLLITTKSYSGDVKRIGTGCLSADGGADLETFYKTYRGKVECDGLEVVTAQKLDVPMPE